MKGKLLKLLAFAGISTMMWGCYPKGPEYVEQYDIVYTNYQKDFTFKGKGKYTMPDSIVKITGEAASGGNVQFMSPSYASLITTRIKQNMAALGYTYVPTADSAQADFAILNASIQVENYYYSYWYDYWYGWYYPGYWGGWYYPYPVVTNYTTGSLFMMMVDRKNISANDKTPVVWVGIVNGLLEGSSTNITSRINSTIDQAYTQTADILRQ